MSARERELERKREAEAKKVRIACVCAAAVRTRALVRPVRAQRCVAPLASGRVLAVVGAETRGERRVCLLPLCVVGVRERSKFLCGRLRCRLRWRARCLCFG